MILALLTVVHVQLYDYLRYQVIFNFLPFILKFTQAVNIYSTTPDAEATYSSTSYCLSVQTVETISVLNHKL